jgi:hypothetical protein
MGRVINHPAGIHNTGVQITTIFSCTPSVLKQFTSSRKTFQVQLLNIWLADKTYRIKPLPPKGSP